MLFASAVIDYDYIMSLIADSTQQKPSKQKMTKAQVISLLKSNSNLMDEEEDLTDYINQVDWGKGQTVNELKQNFKTFKVEKYDKELAKIAKGEPQIAPAAYTRGLSRRWTYLQRTIKGVSENFKVLEEAIKNDLIPA